MELNKQCAICGLDLREVIQFDNFPSGAVFIPVDEFSDFSKGEDLVLSQCTNCSHFQLMNTYKHDFYNDRYSYRSLGHQQKYNVSVSEELIRNLELYFGADHPRSVLEIGANDLTFIKSLKGVSKKIAVDPIAEKGDSNGYGITVYPTFIEDVPSELYEEVELIISRHNLEHLFDPGGLLRRIKKAAESVGQSKYVLVETPDLDKLVLNYRIDQIFLEHIHYFDRISLSNLFSQNGFSCLREWKNDRYGGSICGLFVATPNHDNFTRAQPIGDMKARFLNAVEIFFKKCEGIRNFLEDNYGTVYGFGAGHSTPFLAYHVDGRFHLLEGIVDDDPGKLNKKIKGLNPPIVNIDRLTNDNKILVTATDHTTQIINRITPNMVVSGLLVSEKN